MSPFSSLVLFYVGLITSLFLEVIHFAEFRFQENRLDAFNIDFQYELWHKEK